MEVDMARLRELRRRRVLTLEELAEKANVGRNTIWRLEHGVMGAQPRTIRKLARALGVEPEELARAGDANGEGSIYRRANGTWAAQYTVWTAEGRKRRSVFGDGRGWVLGGSTKSGKGRRVRL